MSFFNRWNDFSFKDVLAVAFSGAFLFYADKATQGNLSAMDVIKTMVPLVSIILAGYFGQEALEAWKQRKYDVTQKSEGVRTDARVRTNTLPPI